MVHSRADDALACILQHCLVCKGSVLCWFCLVPHGSDHTKIHHTKWGKDSLCCAGGQVGEGSVGRWQVGPSECSPCFVGSASCNHSRKSNIPVAGMLCSLLEKAPMDWGICGSPWKSAELGSLFSFAWSCPFLWSQGSAWPGPTGVLGNLSPQRERGEGVGLDPSRSPEDKRLLIAMATNKPCVVTALLSPWKQTQYHIATCASRTHGNGPVASLHPLLDLCSGRW